MPGVGQLWSLTPGTNQTVDPQVNLREGQAPSTLNDAVRQMMAKVKAYVLDTSGGLVTGGTDTAYTLTTNEVFTSLVDGLTVSFRPHVTNGASATLAVDGLAAKPLRVLPTVAIAAGLLTAGLVCRAIYDQSDDEWLVTPSGLGRLDAPVGTRMAFQQTAAPLGWTKESDAAYNNAALRLVTGSVTPTGGTTAFTSVFAARTIALANIPAGTIGAADTQGSHAHTGVTDVQGAHVHTPSNGLGFVTSSFGGGSNLTTGGAQMVGVAATSIDGAHGHNLSIAAAGAHNHNVVSLGSGTPMDFATKYVDYITATKA